MIYEKFSNSFMKTDKNIKNEYLWNSACYEISNQLLSNNLFESGISLKARKCSS